jgi:AraC-like DNA-binding protein
MTLISVVMVFGIVLGIFLGVLLLSLQNRNKRANRFLGFIMIASSVCVSGFGLTKFHLYRDMPYLIEIGSTMIFLLGPLFYFYVKALTQANFVFPAKMYLHFVPFILLILYRLPFFLQSPEAKLVIYDSKYFSYEHRILILVQVLHAFIYVFFAKKIIKQHVQDIKKSMSSIEKINLGWIRTGINLFTIIIGSVALFLGLILLGIKIHPVYSEFIPAAISCTILALGFIGLIQPIIFPPEKEAYQGKKYETSNLTDQQADKYLEELHNLMKNEKPFLKSNLTLQKLAEILSISPHHLSQIINEKMNQNFFDFVNCYRIEEAKQLLAGSKGAQFTILAIGEEVGFNSKSSFNNAFRKYTGKTPTQFKRESTLK